MNVPDCRLRAGGSREEILQAYLKAKQEYTQAGRELKKLQAIVNTLKLTMVKRKYRWRAFRKFITVRAQINFMYLLSERAFRGRIIVNHRDMEMDISVSQTSLGKAQAMLMLSRSSRTSPSQATRADRRRPYPGVKSPSQQFASCSRSGKQWDRQSDVWTNCE